ncbi:MAG: hypothetical protein ACFFD2_06865 [Promethearchaeota archaeon]
MNSIHVGDESIDIALKENLLCNKCGAKITIIKIVLVLRIFRPPKDMVVVGKCPQKHKKKFRTSLPTRFDELSILESHIFKCVECDQPITFKISVQKDSHAKFKIRCSNHGTSSCIVPIDIYNKLTLAGNLIKQAKVVRNRLTEADKKGIGGLVAGGFSLVLVFLMIFLYPNLPNSSPEDILGSTLLYIFTGFFVAACVLGSLFVLLTEGDQYTTLSYISLAMNGTLVIIYILLASIMAL